MVSRSRAADAHLVSLMVFKNKKMREDFHGLQRREHGRDYLVEPGTRFRDYAPRAVFITHDQLVEIGKNYGLRPTGDRLLTVIIGVYRECEELDKALIPSLTFPEGDYHRGCIVLANSPGS
jgi:hypothetical protein